MMSTAFDLISSSVICIASSPLVGWLTRSRSRAIPSFLAQLGSRACSASMKAAIPPFFCAAATAWRAIVVLPLDSGPKTSIIRPRGKPLPPRARSTERLPLEIPSIGTWESESRGMIDPSPNSFSICIRVFFRSGLLSRKFVELFPPRFFLESAADRLGSDLLDFAIRPFAPLIAVSGRGPAPAAVPAPCPSAIPPTISSRTDASATTMTSLPHDRAHAGRARVTVRPAETEPIVRCRPVADGAGSAAGRPGWLRRHHESSGSPRKRTLNAGIVSVSSQPGKYFF